MKLRITRAPVLTLWGTIVAQRLGHPRATALTLGKAVAGMNAQSKGQRLGIYPKADPADPAHKGKKPPTAERDVVRLLGRAVPITKTPDGVRAGSKGKVESAESVERYLEQKFGDALPEVEAAMRALARAHRPAQLAEVGFALYEQFRPEIPPGVKGWGAKGKLDLSRIAHAKTPPTSAR